MKCQICNKNEATICMIKMIGNKKESRYICSECAKGMENNLFDDVLNLINPVFSNLIQDTIKINDFENINNFPMEELSICPTCGQTEIQRQESQKMGCSDCYKFFTLLKNERHIGKIPKSNKQTLYFLNLINEKEIKLKKLILDEKYEEAAILRDEIKNLKKEMKNEG